MSARVWAVDAVFVALLVASAFPVGAWLARALDPDRPLAAETALLRRLGVVPNGDANMSARSYGAAFLVFNFLGTLFVYAIQRLQAFLPFARAVTTPAPDGAWNTAVSFATNTNWQSYAGESTLTSTTQALALGSQNFLSAASGIAVLLCLIRGFTRVESRGVGNFWVDLFRSTFYVLLPAAFLFALFLVSQGCVQSFSPGFHAHFPGAEAQFIPLGPVASQIAIKQLGTNGGGFFNANGAHPFENPSPVSNFAQVLAILLLPAGLTVAFGRIYAKASAAARGTAEGLVYLAVMVALLVPALALTTWAESHPSGAMQAAGLLGENLEGKEVRFGAAESALWATATTAASNGSVNAMHDSFTPLGSLGPMVLMQLGEVVFGGVGSGLYGMILFALVAVFISGLMVGRTPEYLGKKIEAFEMTMACIVILAPATMVLGGTALATAFSAGRGAVLEAGPHGFSEMLYALSSAANNNGSSFAGLNANTPFWNVLTGISMFVGRYVVALPVIALAGSLAAKKRIPPSEGTLRTASPLFAAVLAATVVLVGALTFLPALALGPIAEATGHRSALATAPENR